MYNCLVDLFTERWSLVGAGYPYEGDTVIIILSKHERTRLSIPHIIQHGHHDKPFVL